MAENHNKKIRRISEGFTTGGSSCRNVKGNLKTETQYRIYEGSESYAPGDGETSVDDDGIDVPSPDYDEVQIAIIRLKNNKGDILCR